MSYMIYTFSTTKILTYVVLGLLFTQTLKSENGIQIWPDLTDYSLTPDTPNDGRTLIYKASEPIRWYFQQYDGTLQIKKNFSIKVFPSGENTYLSILSLSKATYMDTGYYIL